MNESKIKILVIGPLPPPFAGPEIVTQNLVESVNLNDEFNVHVLNTTVRKSNSEKGKIDARLVYAYISYVFKLFKIFISVRPTLVFYLPTSATLVGWVRDGTTIFLSVLFRRKVILLMQGGHFRFFFDNSNSFVKSILSWLLNKCSRIYVQAERLKYQFKDIVLDEKLGVFYNFISQDFIDKFKGHMKTKNDELTLLFIGHQTTAKGYCDLLKVFSSLKDVKLLIMGSKGNTRNVKYNQSNSEPLIYENADDVYNQCVASHDIKDKVIFLGGAVKGDEKINVFKEADIFVLPSYSEGFSTAILEAMAAGLPVITTNVGAAPEVIANDESGYVIEPGDIAALANKINYLIERDELRASMGNKNHQLCEEKYSADVVIKDLLSDLKQCVL